MHADLSDYVEYVQTNPASPFCKIKMKVFYASNVITILICWKLIAYYYKITNNHFHFLQINFDGSCFENV